MGIFIALYEQIDMETYTFTSDYYFCTVSGGQGPKLEFDPDAYDSYTIDSIKFSDSIMIMNPMRK